MSKAPLKNRVEAAFKGFALGNSLGLGYEYFDRTGLDPINSFDKPSSLNTGRWCYTTGLMLCIANSLAEYSFDLRDQACRLLSLHDKEPDRNCWPFRGKPKDLGNSTQAALERFRVTNDATNSGNTSQYSSGNGALSRIFPLVVSNLYSSEEQLLDEVSATTKITHATQVCIKSSQILAVIVKALLTNEQSLEECLASCSNLNFEDDEAALKSIANQEYLNKPKAAVRANGYVLETLEASLWAFANSTTAKEALLNAVNLGGDTSTVTAITGMLAGSHYGLQGLPQDWLRLLQYPKTFEVITERLLTRLR